jgi:hypothetical protein
MVQLGTDNYKTRGKVCQETERIEREIFCQMTVQNGNDAARRGTGSNRRLKKIAYEELHNLYFTTYIRVTEIGRACSTHWMKEMQIQFGQETQASRDHMGG